jgi:peptide/nickel transport system permease protein
MRKALQVIPAVLGVLTINFAILHAAPGDITDVLAGEAGTATPEYMTQLRAQFGLDQSIFAQYVKYMLNVVQRDLGYSYRYHTPVSELILGHLPVTLILMGLALAIAVGLGVLLGALAARFVDTPIDWLITSFSLVAYSLPGFWLALMMIIVFSVHLDWLPSSGFETIGGHGRFFEVGLDILRHMVMPSLALAAFYLAVYARLMRASMIEIYEMDYIRTAVAKGVSPAAITLRHVLRNALIPVVTMAALHIGSLIGGAIVIEQVFGLPGIGTLAFEAIFRRDYNLLLGVLLFSSLLVIVVNFALDVAYTFIDPRIELA